MNPEIGTHMVENSFMVAINAGDPLPYAINNPAHGTWDQTTQTMKWDIRGAHRIPFQTVIDEPPWFNPGGGAGGTHIPGGMGIIPMVPYEDPSVYPWLPPPEKYPPFEYPKVTIVTTSGFLQTLNPWTVELKPDSISLQHDMPGVKPEDLTVDIRDNTLTVAGVRRDLRNGANQLEARTITATYQVAMYSPESADAVLVNGVLSIFMKKREEFLPKTVKVRVK